MAAAVAAVDRAASVPPVVVADRALAATCREASERQQVVQVAPPSASLAEAVLRLLFPQHLVLEVRGRGRLRWGMPDSAVVVNLDPVVVAVVVVSLRPQQLPLVDPVVRSYLMVL